MQEEGKVCQEKIEKEKKRSYRKGKQGDSNIDDGKIAENNYEEFIDEGLKWAGGQWTMNRRMKRLKRYQEEFFDETSRLRRQCVKKIDEKIQQEERSRKRIKIKKRRNACEKDKWRS